MIKKIFILLLSFSFCLNIVYAESIIETRKQIDNLESQINKNNKELVLFYDKYKIDSYLDKSSKKYPSDKKVVKKNKDSLQKTMKKINKMSYDKNISLKEKLLKIEMDYLYSVKEKTIANSEKLSFDLLILKRKKLINKNINLYKQIKSKKTYYNERIYEISIDIKSNNSKLNEIIKESLDKNLSNKIDNLFINSSDFINLDNEYKIKILKNLLKSLEEKIEAVKSTEIEEHIKNRNINILYSIKDKILEEIDKQKEIE